MNESDLSKKDLMTMKFIHYFITEKNYNPVIVHGVQNEVWLENMNEEYKIIRIVMNYIHNKEQMDFDNYKVNKLSKQIKKKTFSFGMKVISFYLDINEDVELTDNKYNIQIKVKDEKSLKNNDFIKSYLPDMVSKLKFTEEGQELYKKINDDVLKKNLEENEKLNDLFRPKKPIVTIIFLTIITIMMILMYTMGNGSEDIKTLYFFGGLIKDGSFLRVILSIFLHIGIPHFIMNSWALYILGKQTEGFYGHLKTFIIFMYSGIIGNLLSMIFMSESTISAGASGAIFGLMGAILYFAINQRTYMSEALKNDILPVIVLNLIISFIIPSINLVAHLGGLIGGILISTGLGIKYRTTNFEKRNGMISSIILFLVLIFIIYIK